MSIEQYIQVGPRVNQDYLVVQGYNSAEEKWFSEYSGIGRERLSAAEAEDVLAHGNRRALRQFFPLHNFSV